MFYFGSANSVRPRVRRASMDIARVRDCDALRLRAYGRGAERIHIYDAFISNLMTQYARRADLGIRASNSRCNDTTVVTALDSGYVGQLIDQTEGVTWLCQP